jgi:hypothetical protein
VATAAGFHIWFIWLQPAAEVIWKMVDYLWIGLVAFTWRKMRNRSNLNQICAAAACSAASEQIASEIRVSKNAHI